MSQEIVVQMVKMPVSDIDKAVAFYRDILGLSEDFVVAEYGWAQLSAGNLPIALYVPGMGGGKAEAGKADHLHLAVTDLDVFGHVLGQHNVQAQLHTGNDGTTFYELADPDGNVIKVGLIASD